MIKDRQSCGLTKEVGKENGDWIVFRKGKSKGECDWLESIGKAKKTVDWLELVRE